MDRLESAEELKYLVDNPFILDLENMSVPNFSDRVLDIYEGLFPSNVIARVYSKPAAIESRYNELHAAYKREFMKNYFHNESLLSSMTHRKPLQEALPEADFNKSLAKELDRVGGKRAPPSEVAVNLVDYHLVRDNVQ